jgi:hypothetical protein
MYAFVTEYANAADDGAPYCGPLLYAESYEAAVRLSALVRGPNEEPLTVLGSLVERVPADRIGDTWTRVRKPEPE